MKNEVYTTYNAIVLSISSLFVLVFWYVLGVITFPKDWETHKGLLLIGMKKSTLVQSENTLNF